MSDDLERAAGAALLTCFKDERLPEFVFADTAKTLIEEMKPFASAAILSFLDMDDAGVERLAHRVLKTEGPYEYDHWHLLREPDRNERLGRIRAVLLELRKMAGEDRSLQEQRSEG
jgi:hypothetical protein